MNLTIIAAAVSAALAGSIGFGAAWTLQGRSIDELKLGAANDRIAIYRANRTALERATGQITKAQSDAKIRNDRLAADLAAVGTERDRLRDTSTATVRASAESPEACSRVTSTYNIVFTECAGSLQEMAATLDRCVIERQALSEAWPR